MRELFKELKKCLLRGEGAALASIIESAGSTPRGAGSRMLDGFLGTARSWMLDWMLRGASFAYTGVLSLLM